jgi:CHAT domain-containing protein
MFYKTLFLFFLTLPFFGHAQRCKLLSDSAAAVYEKNDVPGALAIAKMATMECQRTGSLIDYANSLNTFALLNDELGNTSIAMANYHLALQVQEQATTRINADYAQILENISGLSDDADTAIQYGEAAAAIFRQLAGPDSIGYGKALNHLANIYDGAGQYQKAFADVVHSLDILQRRNKTSRDYLTALNNLGAILQDMGKTEYALQVDQSVLDTRRAQNDAYYLTSANNLAVLYSKLGLYQQALPLFLEVSRGLLEQRGDGNANYLTALDNVAATYESLNQYDSAGANYFRELQLLTRQGKTRTEAYANSVNNYGLFLFYTGDTTQAIGQLSNALTLRRQLLTSQHPLTLVSLNNYGRALATVGRFKEALAASRECVATGLVVLGGDNPDYNDYTYRLGEIFDLAGKSDSAGLLYHQNSGRFIQFIVHNFSALSNADRESFINQYAERFDTYASYVAAQNSGGNAAYNGWLYDNILFKKSLLLNSQQLLLRLVRSSLDTSKKKLYDSWLSHKQQLAQEATEPLASRSKDFESLTERTRQEEREIAYQSSAFRSSLERQTATWQQIQAKLKPETAAVEFIYYLSSEQNKPSTGRYAALVLKAGQEPIFVPLFTATDVQKILDEIDKQAEDRDKVAYLYNLVGTEKTNPLSQAIWAPLEPMLTGVTTIYFSPSGILNNIAFGALRNSRGHALAQDFQLVQLFNTKDILDLDTIPQPSFDTYTAAIFSGINYDVPAAELERNTVQLKNGNSLSLIAAQNALPIDKALITTTAWDYLPGTYREGRTVYGLMEKQGIQVVLRDSATATEEVFKQTALHPPDILHIATHGFFFERKRVPTAKVHTLGIRDQLKYSSDPMLRSGLVLAGANYAWQNGYSLLNRDDGILTAYEVSNLDLSHVTLTVLSACQSGLGDAMGDEGNFGLQRAFRLAGAQKLILSLWQVSDEKTGIFMAAFYKNWFRLKDAAAAFRQTQLDLIAEGPYVSSAFILVE